MLWLQQFLRNPISDLIRFRRHWCMCILTLVFCNSYQSVIAQVSPYSLTPDWAFGVAGRAVFPSGSFPLSRAPVISSRETNTVPSPEASTAISFRDGNVALYTNTEFAFNGASSGSWTDHIRNFGFSYDRTCAGSSTGGGIAFPDPASPENAFYLILGNDMTDGNCKNEGVNQYRFTGTGTTVEYDAGPLLLSDTDFSSEAITGATDGAGGYWVVLHTKAAANTFRVWHYTASGTTGPVEYTVGADVTNTENRQAYLKISPCQDKIAYHSGADIVVHRFNRQSGEVLEELNRFTTTGGGVGLEFSPDGSRIYYNSAADEVHYAEIISGITGTVTGSSSWSLQLGPDGKLYASPAGDKIGVISDPNTTATYSTMNMPSGSYIYRGLINLPWLSPEKPDIALSFTGCSIDFEHVFKNYFLDNIGVDTSSFVWDFGDGTIVNGVANPTYSYADESTYTVNVSFKDAYCGHSWTAGKNVSCSTLPLEWLDISAGIEGNKVIVYWTTASEYNNRFFEIQRSSDGIHFTTIGKLNSTGDHVLAKHYQFTDINPAEGTSYYRIIQTDIDGKQSSSSMASVVQSDLRIELFPNPSSSTFNLLIAGYIHATIVVTDVLGRVVYESRNIDSTEPLVFGEELKAGTYILKVITGEHIHIEKIIKQ